MLLDQITSKVLYRYVKGQAASAFSPRVLGACAEWWRRLSVLCFQAYGAVSLGPCDFVLTSELWGQVMCGFRFGSKTHCHHNPWSWLNSLPASCLAVKTQLAKWKQPGPREALGEESLLTSLDWHEQEINVYIFSY